MTDSRPRNQGSRDGSNRRRLSGRVVAERFLRERIKLPPGNVTLQLAIPGSPIELQKPGAKLLELFRGKPLNLLLDNFDLAHDCRL